MKAKINRRNLLKALGFGAASSALPFSTAHAADSPSADKVRGVIFMVSDGMSPGVLTLAEAFSHLKNNTGTAWWELFNRPEASRGFMDTASANSLVTDSAAASSAWGGGKRIENGCINVNADGSENEPIMAFLKRKNPKCRTGLVTTATTTHATPAGFAANVRKRGNEADIAAQYLDRVDVILGGGSGHYDPKTRPDKSDLRARFIAAGYDSVKNRADLVASRSPRLLGTFTAGHLPFTLDAKNNPNIAKTVPSLSRMARCALSRFLEGGEPFLLQIEGARIDHAAHLNDIAGLLHDQLAFDRAIATVLEMTARRDDILVMITSDHGNSNPGLNGMGGSYSESTACFERVLRMKASHERIFSEWLTDREKTPQTLGKLISNKLGFTALPGELDALLAILSKKTITEWNHQLEKPEGLLGQIAGNHTGIGWTGTTHTSDPTILTACGPQSHRFAGIVKNSDVFGHLAEMLS